MAGLLSDSPDWSHLPPIALNLISQKVKSIADYVRFRAVCSPWRSASTPKPQHLPPHLPWLMLPCSPNQDRAYQHEKDDGIRLFYDMWESKIRKLHLPEICRMTCCASYDGWLLLVAAKGKEVVLLNPLTRARIELPSFTVPLKCLRVRNDFDFPPYDAGHCFESKLTGSYVITRVTFSTHLADPNCLITVFLQSFWGIFCCRVGEPCWTLVNIRPDSSEFADSTYYDGRFYLLYNGAMSIIDPNKPEERAVCLLRELQHVNMFLLEQKTGVYVVTVRAIAEEGETVSQMDESDTNVGTDKRPKPKFDLYLFQEKSWKLKKITDTSNIAIFFGEDNNCLGVCSDDWNSLERGSISVYTQYQCAPPSEGERQIRGLATGSFYGIARLDGGRFEPVVDGLAKVLMGLPPTRALWFQPSFN